MTDDTRHDHDHHDHEHDHHEHDHHEHHDHDGPTGRRGARRGGRGRRFGGHHVHHVHVHHHGLGRGGAFGGRRRGPGGRRGERTVEGRIAFLEELQRDLEQDVADVAAKIARLRDAETKETASS